jgi:hypothetical protein
MGASVSVVFAAESLTPKEVVLKKLPDAIEEAIYVHENFPLIIDPSEQAGRFLKYQTGTFINFDDPIPQTPEAMNRALVGALQYGRTLTIKFATLEGLDEKLFVPGLFPVEVLNRSNFFKDEVWQNIIKTELGDPEPSEMTISSEFVFIICTGTDYIPPLLRNNMCVIKVVDKPHNGLSTQQADGSITTIDPMDQIASMFGAVDIVRWKNNNMFSLDCFTLHTSQKQPPAGGGGLRRGPRGGDPQSAEGISHRVDRRPQAHRVVRSRMPGSHARYSVSVGERRGPKCGERRGSKRALEGLLQRPR